MQTSPQQAGSKENLVSQAEQVTRERDTKNRKSGTGDEEQNKKDEHDDESGDDSEQKMHSRLPLFIAGAAILIAIIAAAIYFLVTAGEVTTDDAYTDGNAISMASNVSGYVTALYVNDNTFVRAGDLMLIIDPRADAAALQQARASLALAQAQFSSAQVDLAETEVKAPAQLREAQAQLQQAQAQEFDTERDYRMQLSADRRATSAADIDQATAQLRAAEASVKQAQAQVASASLVPQMIEEARQTVLQRQAQLQQAQADLTQAQVELSYNEIRAPQAGWVTMRNVDLGTYVQSGQQIFYIVSPDFWVTANFKETQLAHMRPGDRVRMTVDAYPGVVLYGHVGSIQEGSGARFSAFPAENATGNYVKIVRRVPVKIVIDNTKPANLNGLPLGISVEPVVTIK
jgi:membrane fusion protein (multidrug efflux system)